jgi:uncharacterized protein (TIGR00290 family)
MAAAPARRTPVLVSWSGGKDAAWMLHLLRQSDDWAPVGLLTTVTEGVERIAMHGIRREVLALQSAAAGLPVIEAALPQHADNASYEASFADALAEARRRWPELQHIAFGDLALDDVRAFREALCQRHGWTPVFPLFGSDSQALAEHMIAAGLHATLCCVDTTQLPPEFAGQEFDGRLLASLPPGVDACGENGEFHTCVHAGPMFALPLRLERGDTVLREERFLFVDLVP